MLAVTNLLTRENADASHHDSAASAGHEEESSVARKDFDPLRLSHELMPV